MPLVYVTASAAGAGKTGVATAIARHFAYRGVPTRLARVAGADDSAAADAAFFASLEFAPGSSSTPLEAAAAADPGARDLLVVEGPPESVPAGARVVLVGRGLAPAVPAGMQPAAIVVTDVALGAAAPTGGTPFASLPSDRTLAGFSAASVQVLLDAEVLVEGDAPVATCDNLVVAPIGSDAGQPYFRRFPRACVVVRYDKTDQHLAALRADPVCLVLTGGRRPSEYTLDAGHARGVPVYLSRTDTENTVILLEGVFDKTRFEGEAKVERMAELLAATGLLDALGIEVAAAI